MKCISYALFGYGKPRQDNCFDFPSYARGFMINVRMARLLFPEWTIVLQTDKQTYEAFKYLFDNIGITVNVNEPAPLCLAMLWRMKPIFEMESHDAWKYTHVICRDVDSPPTWRDAQAVEYWIMKDKAMHAITDSVSHRIPLLGGMIGARPDYFTERVAQTWDEMIALAPKIDFTRKGSDQEFLNKYIYPRFAQPGSDSITQHYFNGMPNTFLSDFRTCSCPPTQGHDSHCKNNTELPLHYDLAASNAVCGHIGAAGFYQGEMFRFLYKHKHLFTDLIEIEEEYPIVFNWVQDDTFK
jgi:hypothetical protein